MNKRKQQLDRALTFLNQHDKLAALEVLEYIAELEERPGAESDCREEDTKFLFRLAKGVWDDVKAQGATDAEALAMVYRAGGDHRIEAINEVEKDA